MKLTLRVSALLAIVLLFQDDAVAQAPPMVVAPDRANGIYAVGDAVRWTVEWKGEGAAPPAAQYTLKSGGMKEAGDGELKFTGNVATFESKFDAPNTVLAQVEWEPKDPKHRAVGGAVAAPEKIQPAAPPPDDFDRFWQAKLEESHKLPLNPQLESADAHKPGVSYWKVTLDNIHGTHIRGQLARPEKGEKFPAMLIPQWAGVYPLQKPWATDRAADGWLTLNILAHNLPIDNPEDFYKRQYEGPLKNYWMIGNDDREQSYYLRMYLSCSRAIEYLKSRPDWDGKTLVVVGTSQGGQQALMTAGLLPNDVTAVMALVPAACDMLAPEVGRASGFPNWYQQTWGGRDAKQVHETSRYFDPVNFARRIKCPALVGCGLRDEVTPPSSVLAAVNQISAPKEVIILPKSGHQDEHGTQQPFNDRCYGAWLPALRQGQPPPIGAAATTRPSASNALHSTTASLRQVAGDGLLIGGAVSVRDFDDPKLASLIAEQFSCITAGNEFKPDSLQHEPGNFTFGPADRIANFTQSHGIKLIGHNLLWHQQSPPWMFADADGKPLPRDKALANLKSHIDAVVKHFGDQVLGWDVVNEAISDNPVEYLRDTPARRAIGDDYVIQAFKLAHAANPNVQLYYNDYNIEAPGKRQKAVRLIRDLKGAGCRVDAVGIQGHWLLHFPETRVMDEAISEFAALGVKVMVTELDVDVLPRKVTGVGADVTATEKVGVDPYKAGLPDDVQQQLARRYGELFRTFARHRGELTRVTFWGVYDGNTWLNDWPVQGRTNHPMLWDRQLQPKPALQAVVEALTETR